MEFKMTEVEAREMARFEEAVGGRRGRLRY
jgi:hypothetical protein